MLRYLLAVLFLIISCTHSEEESDNSYRVQPRPFFPNFTAEVDFDVEKIKVTGPLKKRDVVSELIVNVNQFRYCYEDYIETSLSGKGVISVKFTISSKKGVVEKVIIRYSSM